MQEKKVICIQYFIEHEKGKKGEEMMVEEEEERRGGGGERRLYVF